MRYQLRAKPVGDEMVGTAALTLQVVDNDGVVQAEGHLVAEYVRGEPETMILCGVAFEGIHKAVKA